MTDAWPYAVWPDPRSRSRVIESHSRGVDRQSHTGLKFFVNTLCLKNVATLFTCKRCKLFWHRGFIFRRPFVKQFALCYQTVVCLSCLWRSCTGQTVGRIKMKLGMEVGLGPGHIVLDRNPAPAPAPPKGRSPPIFGPYLLWSKWLHGSRCHLVWS